jgi:sarcosine oxidase subunit beta
VIAAGPWAARVARTVGIALPVNACRTQVALYRRPAEFAGHLSVYGDFAGAVYFKPTWGELVHVGSISSDEAAAIVDPDEYRQAPDEVFLQECHAALVGRVPPMGRAPGRGGYAALYSITPDWHPILDRLPGIDGLYCAVGFSGHGFKLSPAVGELMSELIADGSATTLDIHPLRFSRFEEDQPFLSPSAYGVMG